MIEPNLPEPLDEIDLYVSQRLRALRQLRGKTQAQLAQAAGVTFQQVQKYERGVNRITAGRLHRMGEFLDAGIGAFFPAAANGDGEADIFSIPEGALLIEAFLALPEPQRRILLDVARSMRPSAAAAAKAA